MFKSLALFAFAGLVAVSAIKIDIPSSIEQGNLVYINWSEGVPPTEVVSLRIHMP